MGFLVKRKPREMFMPQGPILVFESTAFPFVDGEEDETSPGVFARSLATWLLQKLNGRGIKTNMLIGEDYGLLVGIVSEPHKLYVACSNADETGILWKVFVLVEGGPPGQPGKKDKSVEALNELHREVKEILSSDPAIRFLRQHADG
jgi:hypothetical protein